MHWELWFVPVSATRQRWMFPHTIPQPVSPLCSLAGDTGSSPIPGLFPTRLDSLSSPCLCPPGTSQAKISAPAGSASGPGAPVGGSWCPQPCHSPQGCLCSCPAHRRAGAASCTLGEKEVSMAASTTGRLCKKLDFFFPPYRKSFYF